MQRLKKGSFSITLRDDRISFMKVFKFGGASLRDAASVRNMAGILQIFGGAELIIVVSAMDKSTNKLEKLTAAWYNRDKQEVKEVFGEIKIFHTDIRNSLLPGHRSSETGLADLFNGLWETLHGDIPDLYDQAYEMIVPYGELFSSMIIWYYLTNQGIAIDWLDARRLIITDDTWREARIHWDLTIENLQRCMRTRRNAGSTMALTQGFIGSTPDDQMVTLGREGSDFTAAVIAYALDAEEVVIWKDVPGLMNADPAIFPDAVMLDEISYHEAIELAYYGAKIIHPKTIKPLQNKNIPLRIKSFSDPLLPGTLIHSLDKYDQDVPSYIIKENQTLISFSPKDFSFIVEKNISEIFAVLSQLNIRANLMQNSAISFSICIDSNKEKMIRMTEMLHNQFNIRYNKDLALITIRHFTEDIIERLTTHASVMLEQRSRNTVQLVIRQD